MFGAIRTAGEVLYAPSRAFARPFRWAEVGWGIVLALGITMLYESRLTGVFEQVRYLLSARGHWDALSLRYLWSALREGVQEGLGWLVVVGMIFVPLVLLFGNAFSVRRPLLALWRDRYRQVLGAAFYGWATAHGVMALPVLVVMPDWAPRYEVALGVAALPPFAFLMGIAVRQAFPLSLVRMLAVLLPALVPLVVAPVVGKALVLVAASPVLALIGHQLLMPSLHRVLAARSSAGRTSPMSAHDAEAGGEAEPVGATGGPEASSSESRPPAC
jgi:hypothetical protein